MNIDSQKMEAIKKAYAEILLNTAKEAAARIMVSERKALRFQQDLSSAKEESLSMNLRLKQIMDSKITEAEIKSLSQQTKIEELEAQLNEAEQIIVDLRFELKEVQDELEKRKKIQRLNEHNLKEDVSSRRYEAHDIELSASDPITSPPLDSRLTITTGDMQITPLLQVMRYSCDTKDLRFELKEVQDELEKGKKIQRLNENNLKEDVSCREYEVHDIEPSASDPITSSPLDSRPTITTNDIQITPLSQEMPYSCDTKDLRFELIEVQDELEKGKKIQRLNEHNLKEDVSSRGYEVHDIEPSASDPITSSPLDSRPTRTTDDMQITPLLQEMPYSCDTKHLDPSSDSHMENKCPDNTDLSSIIMRSIMPEQHRNGCTQRIHAFETTLLDGKLPPSKHLNDQVSPMKNESVIRNDENGEEACTLPSPKAESVDMMKEPESDKVLQLNSRISKSPLVKVVRRRKRKIRYGHAKKTSCRSFPQQIIKPCQPSSLPYCNSLSNVASNEVKPVGACTAPSPSVDLTKSYTRNEEILQHANKGYEDQAIEIMPRGYRKRKVKYRNTLAISFRSPPCQLAETYSPSLLSRCKRVPNSVNGDVISGGDILEMTENVDEAKSDLAVSTSGAVQNSKDSEKCVLVKPEVDSSEGSRFPNCTTNLAMFELPLMNSDLADAKASETNNEASSQADSDRLLKYTFQRKRKKVPLSNPEETTSLEQSALKRRAGEIQTGAPEPLKSSLIDEPSRDSRRLVQVARQLVSLSGKKWW